MKTGNVGIVVVSHSADIARGTADMVRQMVGDEIPLAYCGGNPDGGLGTNVEAIMTAIDQAWSDKGVAILVDFMSPTVVEASTLRRLTGRPVLGTVSVLATPESRFARRQGQQRFAAALTALVALQALWLAWIAMTPPLN